MNFKIKHEVFYQNYVAAVLFAVKNIYIYIYMCVCVCVCVCLNCTIPLLVTD